MKKNMRFLVFLGVLLSLIVTPMSTVQANDMINPDKKETEVDIIFKKSEQKVVPAVPKVPPIYHPPIEVIPSKKPNGQLPHTGELLTSFVMLLAGLSLLIVFVGVANLKRVYYISVLE